MIVLKVRSNAENAAWSPSARINLLGDRRIPFSGYAKMLCDTAASLSGGKSSDAFWATTAELLFTNALKLMDALKHPITLNELYLTLTEQSKLTQMLVEFSMNHTDESSKEIYNSLYNQLIGAKAENQLEGTLGTIRQFLGFFLEDDISEVFSSSEPTHSLMQVDQGLVFCTSIPQHFPTQRRYIHTLFKQLFYYHGMMRYDVEAAQHGYIQKCNRLFGIFDEAQDIITASETGMSDHTVLDRIGGAGVSIIFSMQSAHSPVSKINKDATENLINHFSTRIYFQVGDEKEAEEASKFVGKRKRKRTRKSYSASSWGLGGASRSVDFADMYEVPPVAFLSLDRHQCVVLHPKKTWDAIDLPPLTAKGRVEKWYKPCGIAKISRLIRDSYK